MKAAAQPPQSLQPLQPLQPPQPDPESPEELRAQPNYLILLAARAISRCGDSIDSIAYSWMVYMLTGSKLLMGTLFAVSIIPGIVLSLLSGVLVDRWSVKKVVVITGAGRGTIVFITGLMYYLGFLAPWHLFVFAVINSSFEAFSTPAEISLVRKVLPKQLLLKGISFSSSISRTAEIIGLGVAGTIIAWLGISSALWIDAGTFFVSALLLSFLSLHKATAEEAGPSADAIQETEGSHPFRTYVKELKEGFSYIRQNTLILTTALLAALLNFCMAPLEALLTVYVKESLNSGTSGLSVLSIAMTIGMIVGGLAMSRWATLALKSTLILSGSLLLGGGYALLSIPPLLSGVPGLIAAAFLMFLIGNACMMISVPVSSYMIEVTPEGMLGRVGSLSNMLCLGALPLGAAVTGAVAEGLPLATIYAAMGVLILLPTLMLFRYKGFRRI